MTSSGWGDEPVTQKHILAKFSRQSDRGRMDTSGNYNVEDVTVDLDGAAISKGDGAKGRFVTIGPRKPDTTTLGADGEVSLSKNNDPTRTITITLLRTSASNRRFSDMQDGEARLYVRHVDGTIVFDGSVAVDDKDDVGVNEREWTLTASSD